MSEHKPERHGDSPLVQLMVSMTGASPSEHETEPPGADPKSVKAGHEPDQFEAKAILYVPLFVTVVVLIAFAIVTTVFLTIYGKSVGDPAANPVATKNSSLPLNDRFAMISSTDPNAEFKQPRLEYLKQTEESKDDPAYHRSKLPLNTKYGTYEIRPEDLRPENYINPTTKRRDLADARWNDGNKTAIIPIEQAMVLLVEKKKLPIRANPIHVADTTEANAKQSNGGRGGPSQPVVVVAHDDKKHDAKKPDAKKPEDKKGGH